ncbi:MAG TPA: ABC transporter permease [Egibacteraceae bacterium]|nr:ABC transporter permease [Egibacteraceae bacterium]
MEQVSRSSRLAGQAGLALIVVALWEVLPRALDMSPLVLPPFSEVIVQFNRPLTGGGTLGHHTWVTVQQVGGAFGIAAVAGIAVGLPLGMIPRVRALALPLLTAAFAVPIMVLIPLFLVSFGLGMKSKVAFGALYAFFPVVFNVVAGAGNVEKIYFDVARAYGLSRSERIRKIILRGAARNTLNGLQMAVAISIIAVVSIEMFGALAGLGYLIHRAGQRMRIAEVYALILVTLLVAYLLLSAVRWLGRLFDVKLEISAG